MSDKNEEVKSNDKIKRYALTKQEREAIQNLQSVIGIIAIQREGLNNSMYVAIARVKNRLNIDHNSPAGFKRVVDFDPNSYEMLVIDTPIDEKAENEAKN